MSYRFVDSLTACCQAVNKTVWHIPLLCVQRKTPDDGQRNCPKHVDFYSKNKSEKLVHLVGFIIRIYHDASCQAVNKPVWHIPLLCVQRKTPDDGQRNCPKHVDFYSKNTSDKLVHLVGFIIRTEFGYLCGWREDVVSIIGTSKFNNPGLFRDDSQLLVIATVCVHVVP